jgi:hypothetical protein
VVYSSNLALLAALTDHIFLTLSLIAFNLSAISLLLKVKPSSVFLYPNGLSDCIELIKREYKLSFYLL